MSWDIYGNPLRRGYCEVHPDVHQEYPCSICMAQKQQQSQPHNELEQLQYEFAQQGDYIRHLESERAALAATVEALRQAWEAVKATDWDKPLDEAFEATPQQHLAEIRAQAVEQAVNETKKLESTPCGQWWYCLADDLKKCAERIRQEVLCEKL